MEAAAPLAISNPFCLYERLMGAAARERAAGLSDVMPNGTRRVEVVEVWGTPRQIDSEREIRLYDAGGRLLAAARSR
jgi:hypothetical protein